MYLQNSFIKEYYYGYIGECIMVYKDMIEHCKMNVKFYFKSEKEEFKDKLFIGELYDYEEQLYDMYEVVYDEELKNYVIVYTEELFVLNRCHVLGILAPFVDKRLHIVRQR